MNKERNSRNYVNEFRKITSSKTNKTTIEKPNPYITIKNRYNLRDHSQNRFKL